MKVYIISSYDQFPLGEKLLRGIEDLDIISGPIDATSTRGLQDVIKREIESADVILAIIDNQFVSNQWLDTTLTWALDSVRKHKEKICIPVILDGAEVPQIIKGMIYISCSSNDLKQAKFSIKRMLTPARNKKNEKLSKDFTRILIKKLLKAMIILIISMLLFYLGLVLHSEVSDTSLSLYGTVAAVVVLVSVAWGLFSYTMEEDDSTEQIESYSRRLKEAMVPYEAYRERMESGEVTEKKVEIDALGRMMINLEDIKEFYTWSQKQAKASFALAAGMCIFGFILMLIAIVLPVTLKMSFEMSIIPAIGGVITELIAGTALVVYRNSLRQLNHYHEALHEDERFLSSVNLLGKFSTIESQDEMLREIIRSEIQMNLSGLNKAMPGREPEKKERAKS